MFLGLDKWERLWDHVGAVFVRTKTYKNKDGSRRTYIDQLIEGLARWSHK